MTAPATTVLTAVGKKLVGYLEEAPGVKSSSRLIAVSCFAAAASVVFVLDVYIWHQTFHDKPMDSTFVSAVALVIGALVANGAVAIDRRSRVTADSPCAGDHE